MKFRNIYIFQIATFLFSLLLLSGCDKEEKDRYYGIDTIDNALYGAQPYFAMGFSFELGELTSTLELPAPDITVHANVDTAGTITGKYLNTPNFIASFALAGEYNSAEEAKDFFNSLFEVGTRTWQLNAPALEEDQIWLFKTAEGNYVKFRIMEFVIYNTQYPPYVQMKFEWRIQPDGSTTFSE